MSNEERYLRQIRCIERPDGTLEVDLPDEIVVEPEQEQRLQEEFDRWQKDLDAFSRAHPEAAKRRPVRSLPLQVGEFEADPAPQLKEVNGWTGPTLEYQSGPC